MKKLIALLLALSMLACLCAGCAKTEEPAAEAPAAEAPAAEAPAAEAPAAEAPAAEEPTEPLTIAFSTIAYSIAVLPQYLIDSFQGMVEGEGWTFNMLAAEGDAALQGEQISQLVAMQPDYLVIFPADPTLAIDWCKEASDAGVKVIIVHVDVAEEAQQYCECYCGIDNKAVVTSIYDYIADKNGADTAMNLVEIGGVPVQADYIVRTGTFNEAIAGTSYTQLGDIAWAYSSRADAQTAMENFISAYSDQINILVGFDDDLTLGGVNALQEAGMTDVQVYSITGQKEALQAIRDGKMTMTVFTPMASIAQKAMDAIHTIEAGGTVDYYQYSDYTPVDAANVDQFEGEF